MGFLEPPSAAGLVLEFSAQHAGGVLGLLRRRSGRVRWRTDSTARRRQSALMDIAVVSTTTASEAAILRRVGADPVPQVGL